MITKTMKPSLFNMRILYRKRKLFIVLLVSLLIIGGIYLFFLLNKTRNINVILISIDALRSDHLGCYGYKRNTSPNIDELTHQGVMFTQAITPGGWTVDSLPSIITGTYRFIHGIGEWKAPRSPSIHTLPQLLKSEGIKSALFTNHAPCGWMDISDGFDLIYAVGHEIKDRQLTIEVIKWLKENKESPFFIQIHYHGPHAPYRPPAPYKHMYLDDEYRMKPKFVPISTWSSEKKYDGHGKIPYAVAEDNITDPDYYISQYDGAISYTDTQIGRLMDSLKRLGLLEDTLIMLTADHGEMLGEHEIYFAHGPLYECNVRVPLIIRFPKLFPRGKVIPQMVTLVDIVPTVLETMGINIPRYVQGKSLLTFFKKNGLDLHLYVYTTNKKQVSIRSEDWKLIRNNISSYELYNLVNDPQEQYNLVNERKGKFKELRDELEKYIKEYVSSKEKEIKPLDNEQKEILRSLGYLQ